MLRSAHSKNRALLALVTALATGLAATAQEPGIVRDGDRWRRDFYGTQPAAKRLRINAHGPVTLQAGTGTALTYSVRVSVRARSEAEARRVLSHYAVKLETVGGRAVLTAPGGPVISTVTVKTPRIESAAISTSAGPVEATGVDGLLEVDTGAGELMVDRIKGDCKLVTVGGDIFAKEIGSSVKAETGGGGIHIIRAGGTVNAITGGGQIVVDRAGGIVTARNMAGPVQVGEAGGVQCESASGGIRVSNITGAMRVSTSLGNILASLLGARLADSYLATANGDITVLIPSNVGVNIRAQSDMADTLRRITSDFAAIQVRRQGRQVVGEGPVNGGGPLLQISATAGTIFIRRQ